MEKFKSGWRGASLTGPRCAPTVGMDNLNVIQIPIWKGNRPVAWVLSSKNYSDGREHEDAEFIAGALNVHQETGLTPRQLAEQREIMLDALKDALCSLEISRQSAYVTGKVRSVIEKVEARP